MFTKRNKINALIWGLEENATAVKQEGKVTITMRPDQYEILLEALRLLREKTP